VSYKNKKHVFRPQEDWVVVPDTHEAIISRELWEKVKAAEESVSQGKPTTEGVILPLSGLIKPCYRKNGNTCKSLLPLANFCVCYAKR